MPKSLKPLMLSGLAFFLYSRLTNGAILFYINQRFVGLTWAAALGLILVAASYHIGGKAEAHAHALSWSSFALVLLPMLLGVLIPPQPLGTTALSNRELNAVPQAALTLSAGSIRQASEQREPTLLDWVLTLGEHPDPEAVAGQSVEVIGFVYRREDLPSGTWMVSRFVVTCCVADATAIGLIVRAPDAASPSNDQWVHVQGHFAAETIQGERLPVIIAETLTLIEPPAQPYLYYR